MTLTVLLAQSSVAEDVEQTTLTDAEIAKRLIGKWSGVESGGRVKGITDYKKDKTFQGTATLQLGEMTIKIAISGTWKVVDGYIIGKITKSSEEMIVKPGHVAKDLVLSIDDNVLTYKTDSGKKSIRNRVPKKPKRTAPKE